MTKPVISIVVATHQRSSRLPGLVQAMAGQQDVDPFEMIIVDDGSSDDTWQVLSDLAHREPWLRTFALDQRGGPATARNVGWRQAKADLVAFTDDDCLPEANWLRELVNAHASEFDVVQGRTRPEPQDRSQYGAFANVVEVPVFSHRYETCNISYRRQLLDQLGGFDEEFGYTSGGAPNGEDADLGWRAQEAGARCSFASEAVVVHPVDGRSYGRALRSRLRSHRVPYFVRKHPDFRRHLTAGVFFQPAHPVALVSGLSLLHAVLARSRSSSTLALAGVFSYAYYRYRVNPLTSRRRYLPLTIAAAWTIDEFEIAIMALGSIRWRCLVI